MMRNPTTNSRRGAVMIIVIALLGVLALMVVTLSYGTRVEYMAARNWANSVQARMAAVCELPTFQPINPDYGAVDLLSVGKQVATADGSRKLEAVPLQLQPKALMTSGTLANITISDTSARLDINAVVPVLTSQTASPLKAGKSTKTTNQIPTGFIGEAELARLISNVMEANSISGVDAQTLAHAIAIRRYGKDALPGHGGVDDNANQYTASQLGTSLLGIRADRLDNDRDGKIDNREESLDKDGLDNNYNGQVDEQSEGIDDPAECLADPRQQPNGDDRPYTALTELMAVPGMTAKLYAALAPHLTVMSISYAAFELPNQSGDDSPLGWPQLDPNTAPPELIYASLQKRFPNTSADVIGQFVANLVDRRDADSVPCKLDLEDKTYRGQEVAPYINEVCTANLGVKLAKKPSRHGQFVEIVNPYANTKLDVDGWTLTGAGAEVLLSGTIPANGYYVITDDYNDQNDENRGKIPDSFFANFGIVSSGPDQIIVENTQFDLMAGSGHLELKDKKGNVIDEFDFDPTVRTGMTLSFQRNDPRLNVAQLTAPTPLTPNAGAKDSGALSKTGKLALQTLEQNANTPLRSPLDAMLVSTAHSTITIKDEQSKTQDWPFQLPALATGDADQLDVRLVDCFLPGVDMPLASKAQRDIVDPRKLSTKHANETIHTVKTPNAAIVCGRVNLNTASMGVLASLPGMTPSLLTAIRDARQPVGAVSRNHRTIDNRETSYWRDINPKNSRHWANLSDFLADDEVWGKVSLYDRLNQAYPFAALLGTHTMSMTSVATTRVANRAGERRQSVASAERLLAGDRGVVETVTFQFVNQGSSTLGDPDQRSAVKLSSAQNRLLFQPATLARSMGRRVTIQK